MKLIIPYTLFTCFIMALLLSVTQYRKNGGKYPENRIFSLMCFASAVWSLGFWGVNIQTVPEQAYFFRAIGMVGVFAYLVLAQLLIFYLSKAKSTYLYYFIALATVLGFIICFFIVQKDKVVYELSEIGMTYRFHPGFWNNAYTIYCIAMAVSMFFSILYMLSKAHYTRMRVLAKKLLMVEGIVVFGMLFDTVLPLFGVSAIPGSTIGQFIALIAMYQVICFVNRSRITLDNMSTYVYYSLTTPVLVYDYSHTLQLWNDAARDFVGLKESGQGTTDIDALFSVPASEVFHFGGKRKDIDGMCYHNQSLCTLSINKIHDSYQDIIGYIITVTDLSERMEYITKLETAINEAKTANKAKTIFLANMSHEIRTPMNAILGFSELILKKDVSKELKEYAEGIHLSARNLLAIINDILDITKIESGKMELVPSNYYIAELLDDVSLIISQQAGAKGLEFVMKTDNDIPTQLYGDKVRIRGVLINILNNAVKYTKEGRVTFEIKVLSRTEETVKLAFIVSDTGIGIRPEEKEKLFKSFERLDQQVHYNVEGSGLGLAIAQGYVTLMGGEITVESVYGEGSVFTITIEQKVMDATPLQYRFTIDRSKQDTSDTGQLTIHDVRVLLVDDNRTNLMVAKALLESYGLDVDTADCAMAAIDLCTHTHYPVIFMDQMMPEIDGIEGMRRIRGLEAYYAQGGEGKIIVLTADAIRGAREHLLKLGFDEYLGKPMNLRQLERLLIRYLPSDKISVSTASDKEKAESKESTEEPAASDLAYLKETLTDLDVSLGLNNCGGKISDYLNILKINYTYGEKNLRELETLLSQKDYEAYTIKIHSMKSSARGIGAVEASDMALEQEEAGRAGQYDSLDTRFEAFREVYELLLKKIGEVLRHYHMISEETTEASGEEFDRRMLRSILTNIRSHVDNFEFAQVFEILEAVKQYRLPEDLKKLFSELEALMDDLSVDEIHQLIENALQSTE